MHTAVRAAAVQDAQLICDGTIKTVTLKPLPQQHHGDTSAQAAAAAAFLCRLQPRRAAASTSAGHGSGDGSNPSSTAGHQASDALSLCLKEFSAWELAAWLEGPFGSAQPLPAVGRLAVEQQISWEPFFDSSVMRLAALVPNARHAVFECVLPAGLGPALACHCSQLTSLSLWAKPQPPASQPSMARPPGSSIGQALSGLASLPSLDSLTYNSMNSILPAPRPIHLIHSLAGPVTLRTLVWKESGWDWGDAALMQRLSSALPRLTSLDLTVFPFHGNDGIPARSAHHLRDCFLNLTELKLWAIDGNCWAHVLALLPALQTVSCCSGGELLDGWDGAVGETAGSTTSVPPALPALLHVQQFSIKILMVSEVPRLKRMLHALPRLQRLCVSSVSTFVGKAAKAAAAELASLPLQLQELHAVLARYGGKPMTLRLLSDWPDTDTASGGPMTLSTAVQRWPVLPLITSLNIGTLETVQPGRGGRWHEAPVASSNCSYVTPAAELAARLKRCLPCLRDLMLTGSLGLSAILTPGSGVSALLELALGLPWSLHTLSADLHGSRLTQAQMQGLLQRLADAGRRDLDMQLRVVGMPEADAAEPWELRVCLQRACLGIWQWQ